MQINSEELNEHRAALTDLRTPAMEQAVAPLGVVIEQAPETGDKRTVLAARCRPGALHDGGGGAANVVGVGKLDEVDARRVVLLALFGERFGLYASKSSSS